MRGLLASLLIAAACVARAAEPLPDPLSLADALAHASPDLPEIELALAARDAAQARLAEARALGGVRLSALGELRAVDPSDASPDRSNNDSRARLTLRKRLYDFGYSASREQAAQMAGEGGELRHRAALGSSRLNIMRRFFDVILADLQFARDNEAMAIAFIAADRAGQRHELGSLSDVELARLEAEYQAVLQQRMQSQTLQRATRSALAVAMGRPGELVAELVRPLAPDGAELPDYQAVLERVLTQNPELLALRAEVAAAQAALDAARRSHGPVLSGELEAATYERETSSTHPLVAGLVFELPLLTGGARDAAIAAAQAEWRAAQARLAVAEQDLTHDVLELVLRLGELRTTLAALEARAGYRELYLDRSRALYEMEVRADLGDAMTEISAVSLDRARAEFDWIMTEARLAALSGEMPAQEAER